MNRSLYHLGIFFLSLTVVCSLYQEIIQFVFGAQLFTQESFAAWSLTTHFIRLTALLFLLKYYYDQKYWAALYTGIISTVASLSSAVVFFLMLFSRSPSNYYIPALLISFFFNMIYALTLVLSRSRQMIWLRVAGVYLFLISLILVCTISLSALSNDLQYKSFLGRFTEWALIASCLSTIPFIINFLSEAKLLNPENFGKYIHKSSEDLWIALKTLALILVLVFGIKITSDGYTSLYWAEQSVESARKLARLFEARTFVNSKGDTLFYHLLKPLNFDPKKKYPLVVSLPYGGQPGTDKIRQIEGAAAAELLSTDHNRKKYPAFLVVPNCPAGSGWGGIPNYPSVDSLVYEAIMELDKEPAIDIKRRYVTGVSRGGYGAWHFICTRPEMFAAAIPICGAEDPKLAWGIVKVAVWAFHGAKDRNVPVSGSRDMINAIKKAGGDPKYTEYAHEGHSIWSQVSTTPGLWDWLFAQKRD